MTKAKRMERWIESNRKWSVFVRELQKSVREMYKRKICIDLSNGPLVS